jgi:HSP20 family protein
MKLARYNPNWPNWGWPNRDLTSLVSDLFDGPPANGDQQGFFSPAVDILETEEAFLIQAQLPGLEKDDVKVEFDNNTLTLSGQRQKTEEDKSENYHRIESVYGQFRRSFTLPTNIKSGEIGATFKNGILEIKVEKKPESKARHIKIQ